jgi:hypothetical protein
VSARVICRVEIRRAPSGLRKARHRRANAIGALDVVKLGKRPIGAKSG